MKKVKPVKAYCAKLKISDSLMLYTTSPIRSVAWKLLIKPPVRPIETAKEAWRKQQKSWYASGWRVVRVTVTED